MRREGWARAVGTRYFTQDGHPVLLHQYVVLSNQDGSINAKLIALSVDQEGAVQWEGTRLFYDESGRFIGSTPEIEALQDGHTLDLVEWGREKDQR